MEPQFQYLLGLADGRGKHRIDNMGGYAITDRQLLESFYFGCKVRNLSPKTLLFYAQMLKPLIKYGLYVDKTLTSIERQDIQQFILQTLEAKKISPSSVNCRIRAWKRFYNYLNKEQILSVNPMDNISQCATDKKIRPVVSATQIEMILETFDRSTFWGCRNRCMVMFIYDSAVRVGELCGLSVDNLFLVDRVAKVVGKSRKQRFVPMSAKTAKAMHYYTLKYRQKMPGDRVFCLHDGRVMREDRAYKIIRKAGDAIGLDHLGPHLIRHSAATEMAKGRLNARTLQIILGHTKAETTQRYIHLNSDDIRNEHALGSRMDDVDLN